jgi:molybdopterin-dependent oxidoreductase alpha subunit
MTRAKRVDPSLWASKVPFGLGEQRPNNYLEIWKAIRENSDSLRYALRILNHGVCDGCSLGSKGMRDWTLDEIHLCNIRLRLLRLNTMPALDPVLLREVSGLRGKSSADLRQLGRLPYPMVRRRGDKGFERVSWDAALGIIADRIKASTPDRLGFYLTSRGEPNENYFAAQKAARALGTNSIDNAARICHSPSTVSLKGTVGVAATTCSYKDLIGTDLIVFIGSNVANNQPVMMKYLYHAKKEGTKVALVNPYREPGMMRYWVPSNFESAIFGTKITDRHFPINVGGDVPFLNGAFKHMVENGWVDRDFIERHTVGFGEAVASVAAQSWEELERRSGASRQDMLDLARMLGEARNAVLVWSMGVTQHEFGEANVRSIINLGLTRGFIGREKCGLMPVRGHSGVQGGAEMGAYSTVFPGGAAIDETNARRFSDLWGFEVPARKGMTAVEMIDAAHAGNLDVLFSSGGNYLEVLPDPRHVAEALERVPMRVHMDIVLSSQMLLDPAETVVLLPAATRYEMPGGVTETTTERRVIFSPEIPGPRIGEARAEWEVFVDLAKRARPELADKLHYDSTAAIRRDIAEAIPSYDGIQRLTKEGDEFQYGGARLADGWKFPTPDGKAHFSAIPLTDREVPAGKFLVTTRRGKQFNSMVHERRDALTGAIREAVLISLQDARRLGVANGEPVVLRNDLGEFHGRVLIAPVQPGNLEIHWPEGEVLIDSRRRSPLSGIPDYNAVVSLERATVPATAPASV